MSHLWFSINKINKYRQFPVQFYEKKMHENILKFHYDFPIPFEESITRSK